MTTAGELSITKMQEDELRTLSTWDYGASHHIQGLKQGVSYGYEDGCAYAVRANSDLVGALVLGQHGVKICVDIIMIDPGRPKQGFATRSLLKAKECMGIQAVWKPSGPDKEKIEHIATNLGLEILRPATVDPGKLGFATGWGASEFCDPPDLDSGDLDQLLDDEDIPLDE